MDGGEECSPSQFQGAGGTWVETAIAGGANAQHAAIKRTVGAISRQPCQ